MKKFSQAEKDQIYLHFCNKISLYYIRNNYLRPGMGERIVNIIENDISSRAKEALNFYITKRESGSHPDDVIIKTLSILFYDLEQDETTFFRD